MLQDQVLMGPWVNLVWDVRDDRPEAASRCKIFLQKHDQNEHRHNDSDNDAKEASCAPGDLTAANGENENETIPASVLQWNRQMRKQQHLKKVGTSIKIKDLRVVFVDDHIIVVNKPTGVLTVPGVNSNPNLLTLVHERYGASVEDPAHMIVHRLDMDTSGLVVFGRTRKVTKKLHAQFRNRKVAKEYECLVMGALPIILYGTKQQMTAVHIDLPLQRDHVHPPFMRVSTPESEQAAIAAVKDLQKHGWQKIIRKNPKPSQTELTIMDHGIRGENLPFTRLRLVPVTGRTHQLRVHCAAIGFPIIGDPTYSLYGEAAPLGGLENIKSISHVHNHSSGTVVTKTIPRCPLDVQKAWIHEHPPNEKPMCLHAALLQLVHPITGETMKWEEKPEF
jgi:23S rRNA-/tRNA-specific pseudouridylate synthase